MEGMKKKKSSEPERISQGHLLTGAEIIATPVTRMINNLIEKRVFQKEWNKAAVMPILKKGGKKDKTNYKLWTSRLAASQQHQSSWK